MGIKIKIDRAKTGVKLLIIHWLSNKKSEAAIGPRGEFFPLFVLPPLSLLGSSKPAVGAPDSLAGKGKLSSSPV